MKRYLLVVAATLLVAGATVSVTLAKQNPGHRQLRLHCAWYVTLHRTGKPIIGKVKRHHPDRIRACVRIRRGRRGRIGVTGPAGPAGPRGARGLPGKNGTNGLGNDVITLCVNKQGGSVKVIKDKRTHCDPGHETELHVVVVTP